jgi:hypothetical protein
MTPAMKPMVERVLAEMRRVTPAPSTGLRAERRTPIQEERPTWQPHPLRPAPKASAD